MHFELESLKSLEQVERFLAGSAEVEVGFPDRKALYGHIEQTLRRFCYEALSKPQRGLLRRYLERTTGLSPAQLTRLLRRYRQQQRIEDRRRGPARPFARRYTREDVLLLAETDALHRTLSGPATRKILERSWKLFGDRRYERLARISNGHLYNLRHSPSYQRQLGSKARTEPAGVSIGERRRPAPGGRPGYVRVDTVHQGESYGVKGVLHINAVDEVTQYQYVGTVENISESFLLPVLEGLLQAFPFAVQGFHSDNGSEYINHTVAALLRKLHIGEFTKSRPRRSNDNALCESKNGTTVRRIWGRGYIAKHYAGRLHAFNRELLSPYLNYHRPCFFAHERVDAKGRVHKRYRYQDMHTPYEKFKSLPGAAQLLRPGLSFEQLDAEAYAHSDNEAVAQLYEALEALFLELPYERTAVA